MQQINLSDALFQDAQRRAVEAGFTNVDDYVANMLMVGSHGETPDLDNYFTPERLAEIDASNAEIDAGKFHTIDEVERILSKRKEEWIIQHPPRSSAVNSCT